MQVGEQRGEFGSRAERGNAVELGLERGNSQLVHGGRVHAAGVFIADFLLVGGARGGGRGRGGLLENLPEVQAVQLEELGEAAIAGLVGGQRIALEPAVATEAVKVVAGVYGLVDERRIEDAEFLCGGRDGLAVRQNAGQADGLKGKEDNGTSNGSG